MGMMIGACPTIGRTTLPASFSAIHRGSCTLWDFGVPTVTPPPWLKPPCAPIGRGAAYNTEDATRLAVTPTIASTHQTQRPRVLRMEGVLSHNGQLEVGGNTPIYPSEQLSRARMRVYKASASSTSSHMPSPPATPRDCPITLETAGMPVRFRCGKCT